MPRTPHLLPTVGAALLLLAACETQPQPEPADPPGVTLPARPATIVDTLLIEGMPEPATARLLSATDADPPFSTYVPDGISAALEGGGDTAAVRFAAAFTGAAEPNAYMHVRLYAPATPPALAREIVTGFLRSRRVQDDPIGGIAIDEPYDVVEPPAWGAEAYSFAYVGDGNVPYVGRLVLARYGDRLLHVLTHYPAEYGDGLTPRFDWILGQWRWEDSGAMLTR
jgi:hypothetical protein